MDLICDITEKYNILETNRICYKCDNLNYTNNLLSYEIQISNIFEHVYINANETLLLDEEIGLFIPNYRSTP